MSLEYGHVTVASLAENKYIQNVFFLDTLASGASHDRRV